MQFFFFKPRHEIPKLNEKKIPVRDAIKNSATWDSEEY
jgi:hypothetical protein